MCQLMIVLPTPIMDKTFRENLPYLQFLMYCDKKQYQVIIESSSSKQIIILCTLCLNVLHDKLPLSDKVIKSLVPHESFIQFMSNRRNSIKQKRLQLARHRQAIVLLLKYIIPLL